MARVLVHVSDLHFGRTGPLLVETLVRTIHGIAPDVLIVSGDLTQRARTPEFLAARAFLDRLPYPQIVVPGNHDVPLYNLYGRFVRRLDRFLRYITADLHPSYVDSEVAVFGINTARWFTWKGGAVNAAQVAQLRQSLCALPRDLVKIVATHHPFDLPEGFADSELLRGARRYFGRVLECGADILLCGHLHVAHAGSSIERYHMFGRAALVVHAGTATSTRIRGEPNSFNVLRTAGGRVRIEEFSWRAPESVYRIRRSTVFEKTEGGWALAA
jgi:3',5'-cyclic AMP phosphodiesterase CpdA